MNDAARLIRLSGFALLVAGLLYLPLLLGGWRSIVDVGTPRWQLVTSTATVHHFFLLFGLVGLLAAQLRRAGALGTLAFVVTSLGNAVVGGIGLLQITILPALAAHPAADDALICTPFFPAATEAATAFTEQACTDWAFGPLTAWVAGGWLTLIAGSVLLGLSIARAGIMPPAAGLVLAAGWLVQLAGIFVPVPLVLGNAAYLAIAVAYIWLGTSLLVRFGQLTGHRRPGP